MDVPEPPQIVFEQPAPCADATRAESALRAALAPSSAPGHAWTVKMHVAREKGDLRALGEITDGAGAPVAQRTIDRPGGECAPLARAIGVWASLVLDAEVQRAAEEAPVPAPPAPPPPPPEVTPASPPDKIPEPQFFLANPKEARNVEVGAASLLMTGASTLIAGGSLFEVSEVGGGWFLRPSLGAGRSVMPVSATAYGTLGTSRFDACKRVPGNYLERHGLQLDLCAGPEIGFLHVDAYGPLTATGAPPSAQTLPLIAVGPSVDFRGELGNALSVLIRGVLDVNMPASTPDKQVSESVLIARAEVGLSWRLR